MKIAIVGAGIAGITAALALRRAGHTITLLERSATVSPVGAGITLASNAIQILRDLGVDLTGVGYPLNSLSVRTAHGTPIESINVSRILPGAPTPLAFDRRELHSALIAALPADVPVLFNHPYSSGIIPDHDLLVGADGIRSAVREATLGPIPLLYSGTTCWRALTSNPGITESFEAWGGAARLGTVPLSRNRIYVYLVLTAPPATPRQSSLSAIRSHFQSFASPVPRILDALEGIELLHHDLEELPAPVWGRDRVVLIGDAAHAMTPNLGQGAGMSIEDAVVLSQIVSAQNPAGAIRALRHKRVAGIQTESRTVGKLAHWTSPAAISLRNALLRLIPKSLSDRNYRRMIEPGLHLQQNA